MLNQSDEIFIRSSQGPPTSPTNIIAAMNFKLRLIRRILTLGLLREHKSQNFCSLLLTTQIIHHNSRRMRIKLHLTKESTPSHNYNLNISRVFHYANHRRFLRNCPSLIQKRHIQMKKTSTSIPLTILNQKGTTLKLA